MKTKFTVGEMAKFYQLSKQTLIFYDKIDLFKPNYVDPTNHYRYYTSEQLEVLSSILLLKQMGIPLKDIKNFLEERDKDRTIYLLGEHKKLVDEQIKQLQLTSLRLEKKLETLLQENTHATKVTFTHLESSSLLTYSVAAPYSLVETDIAIKKLLTYATEQAYPHLYQLGVLVPAAHVQSGNCLQATYAFLPLTSTVADSNCHVMPAGNYAITYHHGRYETIEVAYTRLLEAIAQQGATPTGYAYEYCVLDSLTSSSPQEYLTKICLGISS